jgi:hypothetical protein
MRHVVFLVGLGAACVSAGCGSTSNGSQDTLGGAPQDGASPYDASALPPSGGAGSVGVGTSIPVQDGGPGLLVSTTLLDGAPTQTTPVAEPLTCDQAAQQHSYIGCEYWPTVVANNVWQIFDFAVVVANAGQTAATVTVTGPGNTNQSATVPPGQLAKIYLPWVPALKGPDADNCGVSMPLTASVTAAASAFHLISSVPVTVYQFNALEYKGQGGPAGKSWKACPGLTACPDLVAQGIPPTLATDGCFSFSNDASLLLPSTAMTGNYRVAGHEGIVLVDPTSGQMGPSGGYMAITATQSATTVKVKVSATGQVVVGPGIPATGAGGTLTLTLNAGDVAELVSPGGSDLSGSLVQASAPVQVITGHPCIQLPPTQPACDHIEESVFPAETLGEDYVVTRPTGPGGTAVQHQVRIYGNVDGTHLTYNPSVPPGCPTTINAGQVVECGIPPCPTTIDVTAAKSNCGIIDQDFEVKGDQPFAVGTFTLGAFVVDPGQNNMIRGDPAQSFAIAVKQFRSKYVFLAPSDYDVNFVDVVASAGTTVALDGQAVTAAPQPIGSSGFSVYQVKLGAGQAGAHVLNASKPVGIQVVGYGQYTSYMYPGGLDLAHIAAPPPLIQ